MQIDPFVIGRGMFRSKQLLSFLRSCPSASVVDRMKPNGAECHLSERIIP